MPKRTLIPMWEDGEVLYSFKGYGVAKRKSDISAKRVWVGLQKDMTSLPHIKKEEVEFWIFENVETGYSKVKKYNDSLG